MPIPYPQHSTRTREERPSIRTGRQGPVYPDNDRYWYDGNPKAKPLNRARLEVNKFQPPAISYGTPLKKAPPVYTLPDTPSGTSYLHLGSNAARSAARSLAAVQLLSAADAIVSSVVVPATGGLFPKGGRFARVVGPHTYPYPYIGTPGLAFSVYTAGTGYIDAQAVSSYLGEGNLTVPAGWNQAGIWFYNVNNGARFAQHSAWARVQLLTNAHNVKARAANVLPLPSAPAWLDPLASPIGAPYSPVATPYKLIPKLVPNPYRAVGAQTVRGYAAPVAQTAPRPLAGMNPIGGWTTIVRPIGGGHILNPVNPFRPGAKPAPPGKGTYESKYNPRSKGAAAVILRGVGAVTEGLDLVDALHKALPKEYKTGYYKLHYRDPVTGDIKTYYKKRHKASATDKISDLIKSPHKIDVPKALSNIVDENIQDAIYGGIGQQVGKARGRARYDETRRYNADRAKQGRQYRKYTKRRQKEDWVDLGPSGRGYQTGPAL